jgi:hypothetical protein
MKKRLLCTTLISLLVIFTLGITASASLLRASQTILTYTGWLTKSGTTLTVNYDIDATNISDKVGVSQVIVQRKDGTWGNVATYGSNYGTNCISHNGSVTYYGTAGYEYRAVITFYAKQGNVSDSKTYTTGSITL